MMLGGLAASEWGTCGAGKPSSSGFVAMVMSGNGVVGSRPPRDDLTSVPARIQGNNCASATSSRSHSVSSSDIGLGQSNRVERLESYPNVESARSASGSRYAVLDK